MNLFNLILTFDQNKNFTNQKEDFFLIIKHFILFVFKWFR